MRSLEPWPRPGRVASLQDIAARVVSFCRAESITGQVLVIDGGMPGSMH